MSRLEHIKGMDLVVPAFVKVYDKHKNVRLLVVGDGSLLKQMEEDANRLHLKNIIKFVGRQEQAALQSYYDKIDVLLMPSRSEGFSPDSNRRYGSWLCVGSQQYRRFTKVTKNGMLGYFINRNRWMIWLIKFVVL